MRDKPEIWLEKYRREHPKMGASPVNATYGFFFNHYKGMNIISAGSAEINPICKGWEHVSVSLVDRCPTWEEMCLIKNAFWKPDELVIQFHPPKENYYNLHPHVLHLWRNTNQAIELPPTEFL